jgi:hypothetical protein
MNKTKFMTRIFSAINNEETEVLEQLDKDIDIAKEDGSCDTDQYTITASDDKVILHDKVNNEDTEIIENENGEVTFSKVDLEGNETKDEELPLVEEKDFSNKKEEIYQKIDRLLDNYQNYDNPRSEFDKRATQSQKDEYDRLHEELRKIEEQEKKGKSYSEMTDEEFNKTVEFSSVKASRIKNFSLESLKLFAKGGWRDGKLYIKMGDSDVALDLKNKVAIVIDENLSCPIDPKKSFIDNLTTVEKFMKENDLKVFSDTQYVVVEFRNEVPYVRKRGTKDECNEWKNKNSYVGDLKVMTNKRLLELKKSLGFSISSFSDANPTPVKVNLKTVAKLLPYSVVSKKDKLWVSGAVDQESAEAVAKSLNSKTDKYKFEVITTEEVNKGNYKSDPLFVRNLAISNFKRTGKFSDENPTQEVFSDEKGYAVVCPDPEYMGTTRLTHKSCPVNKIPYKWFKDREEATKYLNERDDDSVIVEPMSKSEFDKLKTAYDEWRSLYKKEYYGSNIFSDTNPTPEQEGVIDFLKGFVEEHPGEAKYLVELGAKWGPDNLLEGLNHDAEGDKSFSGHLDRSNMTFITNNDEYRKGDTISRDGEQFELVRLVDNSNDEYTWSVKAYSNKFSKFSPAVAKMFAKSYDDPNELKRNLRKSVKDAIGPLGLQVPNAEFENGYATITMKIHHDKVDKVKKAISGLRSDIGVICKCSDPSKTDLTWYDLIFIQK